jgi:hypothetical protein
MDPKPVFTTAGSVQCGHGGSVLPVALASGRKLTVGGKAVLTASEIAGLAIAPGCSQTAANAGQVICSAVVAVQGNLSAKLTVGGTAVVTESLSGTTNGVPKNTDLAGSAGQSKLRAG